MADQPALNDDERANLVAYLDGELDDATARTLETKLQNDPRARAEAEALRRTWAMLDLLPQPQPSATFTSQTIQRVSKQVPARPRGPGLRRWLVPLAWAEAIVMIGLMGYVGGRLAATRSAAPAPAEDPLTVDQHLERDLRVVENFHRYQHVPDLEFLRALADTRDQDLFGDDSPSP